MDWIFSIIFFSVSILFLGMGILNKARIRIIFIFIGALLLFILGIGILSTGLSIPVGWAI